MEKHLTEKDLIEFQFKLTDESRLSEIAMHLETCSECKKLNEKLAGKFASLELLKSDEKLNEQLIAKTLEQVSIAKATQKKIPFIIRNRWWMSAAAVIFLVLAVGVISQFSKIQSKRTDKPGSPGADKTSTQKTLGFEYTLKGIVSQNKLEEEKPPFAPASAIELTVLPRREDVQLTIYNSADLTLVREKRNLTLKKGWNWLQFMWAKTLIDPTSLSIEPKEQKDKIQTEQLVFPPRLRELGRWLIKSEVEGQVPFEITYFTSGLNWRAFYMGTLSQDEKQMNLESYVRVGNNSGEDYDNAQTRLIVGTVHILDQIAVLARQPYPYGSPIRGTRGVARGGGMGGGGGFGGGRGGRGAVVDSFDGEIYNGTLSELASDSALLKRRDIIKEGLSEYFLYTIEGKETIPNQWGKRLLSFEANSIDVNSLYKYDEDRYGNETIGFVSFVNDEKHNLGKTPIPNGNVKIYEQADSDSNGLLSYVGGMNIKYIPINEEVELNLGPARLVKVEPKLMKFATENYKYDSTGNIDGWDEIRQWKITVTNTKNIPIDIEITRNFNTSYWQLDFKGEDIDYKKHDATHSRFTGKIGPQTKKVIEYTVRTYHGTRQQEMNL